MSTITFGALRQANETRQTEWPGNEQADVAFRAIEVAGEFGEVAEAVKKFLRAERGIAGSTATLDDVADEMADAVIALDLLASRLGIGLSVAVARKFNKTSEKYGFQTRLPEADQRSSDRAKEPETTVDLTTIKVRASAFVDVARERCRQIGEEGWTAEHDDTHVYGELSIAAACYALEATGDNLILGDNLPAQWPREWSREWWKPADRRRNLVKAAALTMAEIERLDRAAKWRPQPQGES